MSQKNNTPDLATLFQRDPQRGRIYAVTDAGWRLDYSRLPISSQARAKLLALPGRAGLSDATARLFDGSIVNPTEDRPALHMRLRAEPASTDIQSARQRFLELAARLHEGRQDLSDLLHIGIGGSDLGPRLVADALDEADSRIRVHWLSTLDGRRFQRLTASLDPARTGVVIASKSFATEETLTQARAARDWLGALFADQAWASTARADRALEFGLSQDHVLPFPEWTGGRFSLWSSVGISAAALIGRSRFERLLAGARAADLEFSAAPDSGRLAVMLALLIHYLRKQLDLSSLGVISYESRLGLLGEYLQQLIMESLGKGVDLDGQRIEHPTAPLIFGGRGTDLQHSIFQALHQGLDTHPLLLVGSLNDDHAYPDWQRAQLAHLLAQARAFALGRADGNACQQLPGNRPVALLLCERLTPERLGYLLASFEHAVYALSVFWRVNAFDQWGVEEGKRLAAQIRVRLDRRLPGLDELGDEI